MHVAMLFLLPAVAVGYTLHAPTSGARRCAGPAAVATSSSTTLEPAVLPPQKAAAPAVRPGEGCKAVYVRVPTASVGCRSLVNCREPVRVVAAGPGSCGSSRRT